MVDYRKERLANGLTVIVHEDQSSPLVAINVLYKVGSKDEHEEMTGLTHLFEHLMFGGTSNVPDFDEPIQLAGGENNAFTNADITNFYNLLPAENIEIGLWLEADRMTKLKLTKKAVETQKKVVIEEFKETCLNEPYGDMWHHLSDMSYQKHAYKWPTIGKEINHIEKVDIEIANEFYDKFYGPHNAILVICGSVNYEKGFELANKWFGKLKGEAVTPLLLADKEKKVGFSSKTIQTNVPSKAIFLAFKMHHRLHPDFYIADLISDILSSGRSSRFYQTLIKEKQLFSYVDAYISGTTDSGLLVVDGKLMDHITIDAAKAAIWEELQKMIEIPLSDRELEKIKNKAESNLIFSESSVMNKSMSLAYYEYLENIDLINNEVAIYNKITKADIQRVAKEMFDKDDCVELIYLPVETLVSC
jgi:zinc protease